MEPHHLWGPQKWTTPPLRPSEMNHTTSEALQKEPHHLWGPQKWTTPPLRPSEMEPHHLWGPSKGTTPPLRPFKRNHATSEALQKEPRPLWGPPKGTTPPLRPCERKPGQTTCQWCRKSTGIWWTLSPLLPSRQRLESPADSEGDWH